MSPWAPVLLLVDMSVNLSLHIVPSIKHNKRKYCMIALCLPSSFILNPMKAFSQLRFMISCFDIFFEKTAETEMSCNRPFKLYNGPTKVMLQLKVCAFDR